MAQAPAPEEVVPGEVNPEKSSKSRLIMIIVVILILLGGGGAAWYFMQPQAAGKGKSEVKEEAKAETAAPVFMTLETFTVNLLPDPGEQYLQTDISLQLSKASNEELIKQFMPLVKAKTLMILSNKKSSDISSIEGKNTLSQEIADNINKLLAQASKDPVVNGVFFTSFIIQ
ncbi:MAG: flagellar basal body-associated protein FliL [Betaproteobacteria bacterium HGW-Betaproteobacteria-8]|nr:MAG: flagellar basal body-associated protein FliL [Betaproteobacteria bacterium HGW-Betaproteobacteria-8]